MLLNLSNHPSANWSATQLSAAQQTYSQVQDLPFPTIDPAWTHDQVAQLADDYLGKILGWTPYPLAVHLMGEMTFSFALVQALQAHGIACVASTTRRQAIDKGDGRKEVIFEFVGFRSYF